MILNDRAVSELLGYILILSITVTAISIIYLLAVPELSSSQDDAKLQNMEQAFTVFDVRASKTQFSGAISQYTDMNPTGGTITVNESYDNSHITIKRKDDTNIYDGPLGTVYYTLNGREVAYQAGGIWERFPTGGSVMISAPDFNYNGETLTLPLMQIIGNDSVAGDGTVYLTTTSQLQPVTIFPDPSISHGTNPVRGENVIVIIKSDYYDAWTAYINERTACAAVSDPENKLCIITFNVKPFGGKQPLIPPINVRNINTSNPAPIKQFYFNMTDVRSNLQMDFRSPASNSPTGADYSTLHISFQKCSGEGTTGVRVIVQYSDKGKVEEFQADRLRIIQDGKADLDLLDKDILTTYTSNDNSWTWGMNNNTFDSGDYVKHMNGPSMYDVIQHYMVQMSKKSPNGKFSLWQGDDGGQHWPGPGSTYCLDYDVINVLTYLHITNNPVRVTIN